jgi:5S rRNA maturation endonuclease (ribonuclease M5)
LLGNGAASQNHKVNTLSGRLKDREEKIREIIAKLVEDSAKGKPIVVEGKKDEAALRALGVAGTIVSVKSGGKSFLEAAQQIEASGTQEVVLLLDYDRRGIEGTKRLERSLEHARIKVNKQAWLGLRALTGKEIQCIESLNAYLDTLAAKAANH